MSKGGTSFSAVDIDKKKVAEAEGILKRKRTTAVALNSKADGHGDGDDGHGVDGDVVRDSIINKRQKADVSTSETGAGVSGSSSTLLGMNVYWSSDEE